MTFETFQYPILIQERHLDTFGHVNNAMYLTLLEEARWDFITAKGFGLSTIQKLGVGPTILECHLKFLKELRNRKNYRIETQTLSYEKKVGVLRQDIFNDQNELCFQAQMSFGLFSVSERKLILPTKEWILAIGGKE